MNNRFKVLCLLATINSQVMYGMVRESSFEKRVSAAYPAAAPAVARGEPRVSAASPSDETTTISTGMNGEVRGAVVSAASASDSVPADRTLDPNLIEAIRIVQEKGIKCDTRVLHADVLFLIAATNGYDEVVKLLLAAKIDPNKPNSRGETPLHCAARRGYAKIVKKLVKGGAALNKAPEATRETPLYIAAQNGHVRVVEYLVAAGANPNEDDLRGRTPLHAAVLEKNILVIIELLKAEKIDKEKADTNGITPLCRAIMQAVSAKVDQGDRVGDVRDAEIVDQRDTEIVDALISAKANTMGAMRKEITIKGADGLPRVWKTNTSLLMIAAQRGRGDILARLLKNADTAHKDAYLNPSLYRAVTNGHEKVMNILLLEKGVQKDGLLLHEGPFSYEATPLYFAAKQGHANVVSKLLDLEVRIDVECDGRTPLYAAAEEGHPEVVKLLMAKKADCFKTCGGLTPLAIAAQNGKMVIGELLATAPELLHMREHNGKTPLFLAVEGVKENELENYLAVVSKLIEWGADVDARNNSGETALHVAADMGYARLLSKLLPKADKNAAAQDKRTPLSVACESYSLGNRTDERREIIEMLLNAAASTEQKVNDNGETVLFLAVRSNNYEVAKLLLSHLAHREACNRYSENPLHIAAERGDMRMVELLVKPFLENRVNGPVSTDTRDQISSTKTGDDSRNLGVSTADGSAKVISLDRSFINQQRECGATPLFQAARKGHLDVVQRLIETGADKNIANCAGVSPLTVAAENGHKDVVTHLLGLGSAGASSDLLFVAAKNGHEAVVRLLLEGHINGIETRCDGLTPLFAAAQGGHAPVVGLLLSQGAKVTVVCHGMTPLYVAAQRGHAGVIEELFRVMESGDLNVNTTSAGDDGVKRTPLLVAAENGHEHVVRLLLSQGAEVEMSAKGISPLIIACKNGHLGVVRALLSHPDVDKERRCNGQTPKDIALANNYNEIAALFN